MQEIEKLIKDIKELIQDTEKLINNNNDNQDLIEIIKNIDNTKNLDKYIEYIKSIKKRDKEIEQKEIEKNKNNDKTKANCIREAYRSKNLYNITIGDIDNGKYLIENNKESIKNLLKDIKKLKSKLELELKLEKINKNTIYFGAPGTGKSYKIKEIENFSNKIYSENNIFRTTFHEAYSYSDFLGQYKPRMNGKDIEYSYCEGIFLKALIRALKNKDNYIFLIIEEINRGNCAEIFGEVFQLLDRNENGESIYGISTSEDIKEFLKKNEIENIEKIKIPENLYILATMNTSDQSLYPLDSAFKRRWEMEYIKIDYNHQKIKDIKIMYKSGKERDYNKCLKALNKIIIEETGSEDKQMGQFFIKTDNNNIDYEHIRSKILQYLFFDVFKHRREIFSCKEFSELIEKESFKDCFIKHQGYFNE